MKLLALACLLAGVVAAFAAPADEDAKLAAFFRAYLNEHFRRHPYDATRAGDHRFDHLLDDLSPAARDADLSATKAALSDLPRRVDYAKLSRAGQIDFEIVRHSLTYKLWQAETRNP